MSLCWRSSLGVRSATCSGGRFHFELESLCDDGDRTAHAVSLTPERTSRADCLACQVSPAAVVKQLEGP